MLGLRTEVFAQRIHRNVLGCVPITKELESVEVLETTHEKAKFLGKLGLPTQQTPGPRL